MTASAPDLDEFDQEDIPTGVKLLIAAVPMGVRPFAEAMAKEHYAMLKTVRDIRSLLRLIRILLFLMPAVSAVVVAIVWVLFHVEIKR